jgi:periplasmic protein TonB
MLGLQFRRNPMGQILFRGSHSKSRGSDAIRSNVRGDDDLEERKFYNRSSLAVEAQNASYAARPPAPHLVARAPAQVPQTPPSLSFQGLDVLTADKGRSSNLVSVIVHVLIITAILWLGLNGPPAIVQPVASLAHVDFKLYDPLPPKVLPVAKAMGGGGGGGAHQIVEPTRGKLPVVAKVQLMPAQLVRLDHPKLAVEPTMKVALPESSNPTNLGMPQSQQVVLQSQGAGSGSGFGHGLGGGIGLGSGTGVGPGTNGGYGGGVMSVGGGVSAPQVIHSVEPEFTPAARQANHEGTVAIQLIVDSQGNPQAIRVSRRLGMGLDEKAVEAVRQYRFRPAMYQGHPVAVQMIIEVEFHLH